LSEDAGLDLVEISPNSSPPVCRIMDYGKYLYDLRKKEKEARRKQRNVGFKEVKFSVKIGEHDYQTKLNHLKEFLEKGNKVKASIFLRGREMTRSHMGVTILRRVAAEVEEYGVVERSSHQEGNIISLMLSPKSSKNTGSKGRKEQHGQEAEAENKKSGQEAV